MCKLTGILAASEQAADGLHALAQSMTAVLAHLGPDSEELLDGDSIAL